MSDEKSEIISREAAVGENAGQSLDAFFHQGTTTAAGPRVGLDKLDELPLTMLSDAVKKISDQTSADVITEISFEGVKSGAVKRMLARDIAIGRVSLRIYQSLLNKALYSGTTPVKRLQFLEKLVDRQHRRLMASLDALERTEARAPTVSVTAEHAAIVVGKDLPR